VLAACRSWIGRRSTNRKFFGLTLGMLLALCVPAEAQEPKKAFRIGFLTVTPASSQALRLEDFRQGLKDLGYIEGQTITIEYRFAEGKRDRISSLATDLVRLKVAVTSPALKRKSSSLG
jgi:putative ABC transport system substrate-binding protein